MDALDVSRWQFAPAGSRTAIGTVLRRARRLVPRRADYASLKQSWRRDVLAGVTVGVVALPLALAFGISSGLGAGAGLVTAIVAGVVAAVSVSYTHLTLPTTPYV